MKAAVYKDLQEITIEQKDKPQAEPGQAVIKVEYCGICGSDLHGYVHGPMYGIFYSPGVVLGHECSGVVHEVGEGVENVEVGDRVVVLPTGYCGTCEPCLEGKPALCTNVVSYIIGHTLANDGAYAEYLLVKNPSQMLHKLPDNVSFQEGALVEPLAVALHGVRQSRFKPGDVTAVIGAGPIGLGTIQFLKLGGAGKIIVLEISPERAEAAKTMGADVVLNPSAEGEGLAMVEFGDLTNGAGADIVYECSGVPWGFQNGQNLMKPGGQVMILGVMMEPVPLDPAMFILKETEMKGCFGYNVAEFKKIIDLLGQKKINIGPLISEVISLDDIQTDGFQRLLTSKEVVKILVRP